MTDDLLEQALNAYHFEYHRHWRDGGDAQDHDEAHRCGIEAVLELTGALSSEDDRPESPEERLRAALIEAQRQLGRFEDKGPKQVGRAMLTIERALSTTATPCHICKGKRFVQTAVDDGYPCPVCNPSPAPSKPDRWECRECGPLHGEQIVHESHSQIPFCSHCGLDVDPA